MIGENVNSRKVSFRDPDFIKLLESIEDYEKGKKMLSGYFKSNNVVEIDMTYRPKEPFNFMPTLKEMQILICSSVLDTPVKRVIERIEDKFFDDVDGDHYLNQYYVSEDIIHIAWEISNYGAIGGEGCKVLTHVLRNFKEEAQLRDLTGYYATILKEVIPADTQKSLYNIPGIPSTKEQQIRAAAGILINPNLPHDVARFILDDITLGRLAHFKALRTKFHPARSLQENRQPALTHALTHNGLNPAGTIERAAKGMLNASRKLFKSVAKKTGP